jgi:signal transduction histidine kinase/ActR/RegA family two-component response regulator
MGCGGADIDGSGGASSFRQWMLTLDGRVESMNAAARAHAERLGPRDARYPLIEVWPEASRFSLERALCTAAAGQIASFRTFDAGEGGSRTYWETLVSPVPDARGAPVSLMAVSRDVTDEVEGAALLEAVVQSLPSPLVVHASDTGRYVLWNRAAEAAFGVEAEQAIGQDRRALFGDTMGAFLDQTEPSTLKIGETRTIRDVRASEAMGGGIYDFKVLATFDDLGARHVISLGEDVREHRRQAEALGSALSEAKKASEAKSLFLANMSHEVRTPLNGIVASAHMLARGDLPACARELVEIIRDSSVQLERLLGDVLDLTNIEAGRVAIDEKPFHLGELLRGVEESSRLTAGDAPVAFSMAVSPELATTVIGDSARLRQVLVNLISNATKFTERGSVSVSACRDVGGWARFTVSDTGIGFDAADKDRIFERFQQADDSITRRFGGSGLGLSIARELVALMGGFLDCESKLGEGARFWFCLPLPVHEAAAPEATEADALEGERAVRILLADDHPTNRRVVELMLADAAELVCVENGREAVRAFSDAPVDVVLMDVQMPVMDGLSAVREIRRLERERGDARAPIIMLTANAGEEHAAASRAVGADLHLEKPITATDLFSALNQVLAHAQRGETAHG